MALGAALTSGSSHDGLDGLLLIPNGRCSSPSVHDLEGLSDDGIMIDVNNDGSATISQAAPSSAAGAGKIPPNMTCCILKLNKNKKSFWLLMCGFYEEFFT